ncbi:hypothetical protein [Streptomyces sp. cmx-18-6]|uniref:hypothetical protein n=1 Tax=Streptomyces sp. cmx-18-6 TaxID=2790930 RepID=UPI0039809997
MAMSANPDRPDESRYEEEERLACGRLLTDVWDAWDAGGSGGTDRDPHLGACPHCASALADLAGLSDAVRRTCAEEPGVPEATSAAVTARVMDLVRLELRPGRPIPLGEPDEDHWIVEAAAARLLRAAVDALPGVRAGSCRIAPLDPADPAGPVHVRVEVVANLTRPLPDLADAVRARIAEAADQDIGIRLGAADVLVVDILDDDDNDDHDNNNDDDHDNNNHDNYGDGSEGAAR